MRSDRYLAWWCVMLPVMGAIGAAADMAGPDLALTVREPLGQSWTHELVVRELPAAARHVVTADWRLLDEQGLPLAFQLLEGDTVALLLDLKPNQERHFRFLREGTAPGPSALVVTSAAGALELRNGLCGIRLATDTGAWRNGPVLGVQLRSGRWAGGSRLLDAAEARSYQCRVLQSGPLFAEAECSYVFANGMTWRLAFRVIAGEPVVLVRESGSPSPAAASQHAASDGAAAVPRWRLRLDGEFKPNQVLWRYDNGPTIPKDQVGCPVVAPLAPAKAPIPALTLQAWHSWWEPKCTRFLTVFELPAEVQARYVVDPKSPYDGKLALFRGQSEVPLAEYLGGAAGNPGAADTLFAAAGCGSLWARDGEDGQKKGLPLWAGDRGEVYFDLPLDGTARVWLLGSGTLDRALVGKHVAPEMYSCMMRFCETSLQDVLAMRLDGLNGFGKSRLFIPVERVDALRGTYVRPGKDDPARQKTWDFFYAPSPAGDEAFRQELRGKIDSLVGRFCPARGTPAFLNSPSANTHHVVNALSDILLPLDMALARPHFFAPEEEALVRRQLLFLARKIASPDFYSEARHYSATANMTTLRNVALVFLACLMPDVPEAQTWTKDALASTGTMFEKWIGPEGEWLESPHYQLVNGDLVCMLLAAERAGLSDLIHNERFLASWLYLARTLTPPDARCGNLRYLNPVGHTYRYETTCMFSVMARIWQEKNPAAAAELQWAWQQTGKPLQGGLGGQFMINGFSEFMIADFTAPPPATPWLSRLYPHHGAVLRHGFPGTRETVVHLLQGDFVQHYDEDRGSFTFWGKGQPLAEGWSYDHENVALAWTHSKMLIGGFWDPGEVREFASLPAADALRAVQKNWHRQLLLLKDADPAAMTYLVLNDSLGGAPDPSLPETQKASTSWRFWLNTREPLRLSGQVAHMRGLADVDLELWFSRYWTGKHTLSGELPAGGGAPATPDGATIKTVPLTAQAIVGNLPRPGWNSRRVPFTQQAIVFDPVRHDEPAILAVLYPRLRDEAAPRFRELAGGKGVEITAASGRDLVFLSRERMSWREGEYEFTGTSGAIRERAGTLCLILGAAGTLRVGAEVLEAAVAAEKTVKRPHGDTP